MKGQRLFIGFNTQNMKSRRGWTIYDLDLVKQDLLNHFHTRKGERLMMANYGTRITDLLFEPFTPDVRSQIEDDVREVVAADPRVQLLSLKITSLRHGIRLDLELKYTPWDVVDTFSVNFDRRSQERQ